MKCKKKRYYRIKNNNRRLRNLFKPGTISIPTTKITLHKHLFIRHGYINNYRARWNN